MLRLAPWLLLGAMLAAGCGGAAAPATAPQPEPEPEPAAEAATDASRPEREARVPAPSRHAPAGAAGAVRVASVTDGDTIRLVDGRAVRLVQIDTPETHSGPECGGAQATAALRSQLPTGTRVRLVIEPVSDAVDRYGRLLRYVYKGQLNLNLWLVARGHATPYFYAGEQGRHAAQLLRSTRTARSARIGLWGRCPAAVLDAMRGVSTGALGRGAADDAASGAAQLVPAAPPYPPDVDCGELPGAVRVGPGDPHRLDADGDDIGCDR